MNEINKLEAKIAELETDLVLCRQIITDQRRTIDNDHEQQIYLIHLQKAINTGELLNLDALRIDIKAFNLRFK